MLRVGVAAARHVAGLQGVGAGGADDAAGRGAVRAHHGRRAAVVAARPVRGELAQPHALHRALQQGTQLCICVGFLQFVYNREFLRKVRDHLTFDIPIPLGTLTPTLPIPIPLGRLNLSLAIPIPLGRLNPTLAMPIPLGRLYPTLAIPIPLGRLNPTLAIPLLLGRLNPTLASPIPLGRLTLLLLSQFRWEDLTLILPPQR